MPQRAALKASVNRLRSDAVIDAVHRLLASKGYEQMTVDEVAAQAGLAKASLYKLFASKEELAAAAMVRVLDQALALTASLRNPSGVSEPRQALDALKAVAGWAMAAQLKGDMPALPAHNTWLSDALMHNSDYTDRLLSLSNQLGIWIAEAQSAGLLNPKLPPEFLLYSLFACACHPVLGLMKDSTAHSHAHIAQWLLDSVFNGLQSSSA